MTFASGQPFSTARRRLDRRFAKGRLLLSKSAQFYGDELIFYLNNNFTNCATYGRPFPSSCLRPLQRESKCKVFVMKISFHSYVK